MCVSVTSLSLQIGICLVLTLAGCSDGPKLGSVKGTVKQNGEPIPFAYVVFQPIEPRGTYGAAYSNEKGEYEIQFSQTRKGALVGRHEVTVRTAGKDEIQIEDKSTGLMVTPPLPPGYKPRLEVKFEREVSPGRNVHDLDIAQAAASDQR